LQKSQLGRKKKQKQTNKQTEAVCVYSTIDTA